MTFLGLTVPSSGVAPLPEGATVVRDYSPPRSYRVLRRFPAWLNYTGTSFTEVITPLNATQSSSAVRLDNLK